MCEEYLSSKEIVQKIADLKIRLALQQEFEQEVDKLVAEVNPTDAGQTRKIREMEEKVLRDIAAHTGRRKQRHEQKRRFPRYARVIAAIALLITVSVGSAMATVHMVQIGLLKLDIQTYPERTSYGLVPSDAAMDVPAVHNHRIFHKREWTGMGGDRRFWVMDGWGLVTMKESGGRWSERRICRGFDVPGQMKIRPWRKKFAGA